MDGVVAEMFNSTKSRIILSKQAWMYLTSVLFQQNEIDYEISIMVKVTMHCCQLIAFGRLLCTNCSGN